MTIYTKYYPENIAIYYNDEKIGTISYEVFMLRVLSPKQLCKYEKNPEIEKWDVRQIDLNYALTHQEQSIKYLYV